MTVLRTLARLYTDDLDALLTGLAPLRLGAGGRPERPDATTP